MLDKLNELKKAHDEYFNQDHLSSLNTQKRVPRVDNKTGIRLYCDALKRIEKQRIAEEYVY